MTDVNANGIQTQEVTLFDKDGVVISADNPIPTGLADGAATEATLAAIKAVTDGIHFDGEKLKVDATLSGTLSITEVHITDSVTDEPVVIDANGAMMVNNAAGATAALQTSGAQKTQVVDGDGHIVNVQAITGEIAGDEYGALSIAVIHGKTTGGGGGWVDVKVNPSGALTTESAVVSSALPTGAATALKQSDGSQKAQIVDGSGNIPAVIAGANTGVKGLRVYGGPTDPISDIPVHIDYNHHQNHEGEAYQWTAKFALTQNVARHIRISVPNLTATTHTPHFLIEVMSTEITDIVLYEGTTWTAVGAEQTTNNRNRNSTNVSGTKIYLTGTPALTVNAQGTEITRWYLSPAKVMTTVDERNEWILKTSTEYDLVLTSTNNASALVRLAWCEDQGL